MILGLGHGRGHSKCKDVVDDLINVSTREDNGATVVCVNSRRAYTENIEQT